MSTILEHFPIKVPVTTTALVAHRQLMPSGKVSMMWAIFLNGEHIGMIHRNDRKYVHDNWNYTLNPSHKADKELCKQVFDLKILVWRAYKAKTADVVDYVKL